MSRSSAAISFQKSGERQTARYVSATTVYEEALEHGRWIGLYWSASGQIQKENVVAGLPGLGPQGALEFPLHAFDLGESSGEVDVVVARGCAGDCGAAVLPPTEARGELR